MSDQNNMFLLVAQVFTSLGVYMYRKVKLRIMENANGTDYGLSRGISVAIVSTVELNFSPSTIYEIDG